MLLASDITERFPFVKQQVKMFGKELFHSTELFEDGQPLYTIELSTSDKYHETKLKVQKRKNKGSQKLYATVYEGNMNSPKDLCKLFHWLEIDVKR